MNPNNHCNVIHIFIYVPHHFWRRVIVKNDSKIRILNNILRNNTNTFIYKGNIIDSESTFEEIDISDGTLIVAIKNPTNFVNEEIIKWIRLTNDSYFENKVKVLSNKKLKREQSRIKDIRYMKLEGNFQMYKNHSHRMFLKNKVEKNSSLTDDLNINYHPLLKPSTDAMPIIW